MRVGAILVLNDRGVNSAATGKSTQSSTLRVEDSLALVDVLGRTVLERMLARLRDSGVRNLSVIGGSALRFAQTGSDVEITVAQSSLARWLAAQQMLSEYGKRGVDIVFVIGVGAYVEWNVVKTLKFHLTTAAPLTQFKDENGPLDFWIVDSKWFRTAASDCRLPFRYGEFPGLPVPCPMDGYVNRLTSARDLRRLVLDTFESNCEITPTGKEVKAGVWIDEGARVHKLARLVAPAYVGRNTVVEPSAVITRCSNVERECRIGQGTVVEESTILPHTLTGHFLDISQALLDGTQYTDLQRTFVCQIDDSRLLADATPRHRKPVPHRTYPPTPARGKSEVANESGSFWSRSAARWSEVWFKG